MVGILVSPIFRGWKACRKKPWMSLSKLVTLKSSWYFFYLIHFTIIHNGYLRSKKSQDNSIRKRSLKEWLIMNQLGLRGLGGMRLPMNLFTWILVSILSWVISMVKMLGLIYFKEAKPRWWFQTCFLLAPIWEDSHVDKYFSNGWLNRPPKNTSTQQDHHNWWFLVGWVGIQCLQATASRFLLVAFTKNKQDREARMAVVGVLTC